MAKKKGTLAPKSSEPLRTQISIINLKGTEEFKAWLTAESKRTHIPSATIVRLGLALWAEQNGGVKPPEK